MVVGGIGGGSVFLFYQVVSRGGTFEAIEMFRTTEPWRVRIMSRLVMLGEVLLSDREHRAMWSGPPMPEWQFWLFPAIVMAACIVCLTMKHWPRFVALQILILTAILLFSRMPVAEHHLIVVVPLAATACVLAGLIVSDRYSWGKGIALGIGAIYFGSAIMWQVAAIRGLASTRGVGQWSDSIFELTAHLERHYANQEVKFLDWGFQNNFYVLSDGRVRSREIVRGPAASAEMRHGGIFVLSGPGNRVYPAASEAFLETLAATDAPATRHTIRQRNQASYAEVIEVPPGDWQVSSNAPPAVISRLIVGDPKYENQLEGFHEIEEGGQRWTKQQFAIILAPPLSAENAKFVADIYVPDASIEKLGAITLTARLGGRTIGTMVFSKPGSHTFIVDSIEAAKLIAQKNRIDFMLDKAFSRDSEYARELGIVIRDARLEAK
jgi:hypothetical protein